MKQAEEYLNKFCSEHLLTAPVTIRTESPRQWGIMLELIKAVQLDAWKQGMSDAATLCAGNDDYMPADNDECKRDIESERDRKDNHL